MNQNRMIIDRAEIDLLSTRRSCTAYFARWDAGVSNENPATAIAARRDLLAFTRLSLSVPIADYGGIYLFHRPGSALRITDIAYIGIAKGRGRPMRVRIEDRLRDDSCFDASLDGMPTSEAFSRIERRLRVAMPRSRANYVGKHLRTCELVRCSGRILLNAVDAEASVIENAERLLIGSAWALGAHLKNKQHLKFRSPSAIDGCRLATEFVTGLRQHGWTESSVQDWLSALASTAHLK